MLTLKYAVSTVRTVHSVFNSAMNAAVEEIIIRNKISRVNLPKFKVWQYEVSEEDILNQSEVERLIKYVKENETETHYTLKLLLATTGMRKGEALALRWSDVDFEKEVISISRTRDHLGERSTKTDNSQRTIDVSKALLKHLKKYKLWSAQKKMINGMKLNNDDHILINTSNSEPVAKMYPNQLMERVFEKGIIKRVTPHTLRHTYASLLISKGIPVTTVAKMIGDAVEMVLRVYAHSFRQKEHEADKVINDMIKIN